MKKRIIALSLTLALCFTLLPANFVFAEESVDVVSVATEATQESVPLFNQWALDDLVVGDTYGIYPLTAWYSTTMTTPIKQARLRVLLAGIRKKIVSTECATELTKVKLVLDNEMTVKEVLEVFYSTISAYEYTQDIGIATSLSAVEFMEKHGIFTNQMGELTLEDICTTEQACTIATRLITYIYDALDAASKGFLWEVKSGENKVYMLGSIHLASYDIYPFSNDILQAFQSSDALIVEAITSNTEALTALVMQYGMYSDGTTLKDYVSAETYQKTIEVAALLGLDEATIAMIKPWLICSMFEQVSLTASTNNEDVLIASLLGIDNKFMMDASMYEKPIYELEGLEYQYKIIDSYSDELDEYLLISTIETVNDYLSGKSQKGKDTFDEWLEYWHDGDVEAMSKVLSEENDLPEVSDENAEINKALNKEYKEKLLTTRDVGMADKIDQLLKGEGSATYFVIVGSFHYISDYDVLDILEEKGYTITQIK